MAPRQINLDMVLCSRYRPHQDDLLRLGLIGLLDYRHALVKLASLIDWDFFEREWAGVFASHRGRPATSPRLVAGPMSLQHAFTLSDEAWSPAGERTRIASTSPGR